MGTIDRLSALFEKLPGIGPRQAQRFVHVLLRNDSLRREITRALAELADAVRQCPQCQRFHAGARDVCDLCAHPGRDDTTLAIVAHDADVQALEHSGTYGGRYFVLGGTISLASESMRGLRVKELLLHLQAAKHRYREIILAFPAHPEGDITAARLREAIKAQCDDVTITMLGRGLSTGSELEYADPETLKSAFANRK